MIKLIASDMDGTLLDENGNLPKDFFHIFNMLKSNDIIFAVASGRQYATLKKTMDSIKDDVLFIAENGSLVVYKNKELYSCYIDKENVNKIIDVSRSLDSVEAVLCGKYCAYTEAKDEKFIKEMKKYYASLEIVDNLKQVKADIIKIAVCDMNDPYSNSYPAYFNNLKDQLSVVISGAIWVDIMNPKANKGEAIKYILDKFNISSEETMAFGDYFNDVEMLKIAGHSYAMENAPEGVKKHAKYIAKSNIENGVLSAIKDKILA
ncbi:HAD family hydrolase [Clostridium sp. 19966]|uniref:Cof-type HAD-IIB family hydrolase n=1 Tax=Clostridium sp. 19966 TaxID=2768166 RepID=UPI0028DE9762|nr:Cof-type HAD-IIB family hydrolase [Clostridium sp. 19966]MDT8715681.1 HAD family hydrolase [Clostridium sp. 19966]